MTVMNSVMVGLLVAVGIVLLYMLWFFFSRKVLFKLGLRNIPRRPTQSILIVIGLTLSTIIIVSALSIGDTLNLSIKEHAIKAYGEIDEIIAPPLLSLLSSYSNELSDTQEGTAASTESEQQFSQLMEGGLPAILTVLRGGLPGISMERYEQLRTEVEAEPLIDAVAGSILFPTIIHDVTNGQGEPLGFIFAVDADYDEQFGLTTIEGESVVMEDLQPGLSNVFVQMLNLLGLAGKAGTGLGLDDVPLSNEVAQNRVDFEENQDHSDVRDRENEEASHNSQPNFNFEQLHENGDGENTSTSGTPTTTVPLEKLAGIVTDLLGRINLNTLGKELDQALAQAGLQLRQGDVYLNRLGAERLGASVGDVLEIYIGPLPIPFRVRSIVEEAGPVGSLMPVVMMRLDEAQELLFMNDKINSVLVSNQGDALAGLEHTKAVSQRLRTLALASESVAHVTEILRQPAVLSVITEQAGQTNTDLSDENVPLISSLLEEIEKTDAGNTNTIRELLANANIRTWLSQVDLPPEEAAELNSALGTLNQFELVDFLSKSTVVTAATVAGGVFTSLFSLFGVLSILAGVLLIFLIFIMMAAERRSEIGLARAIGVQRSNIVHMFVAEGVIYDLVAAALGVLLGLLISRTIIDFVGQLFNNLSSQLGNKSALFNISFHATPITMIIAYCAGVFFTFIIVVIASQRASRLNIVAALRNLPENEMTRKRSSFRMVSNFVISLLLIVFGGLILSGLFTSGLASIQIGLTFILVGAALVLRQLLRKYDLLFLRVQRIVYTIIGLGLMLIWIVPWDSVLNNSETRLSLGNSTTTLLGFALTVPLVILGAILVIMFNADLLAGGISRLLGRVGALAPILKTAIAYPLSTRFRTSMAMILFAMIISTVTIMAMVIEATQTAVAPSDERNAGFDISTSFSLLSFFSPVEDLEAKITSHPDFPQEQIAVIGSVSSQLLQGIQLEEDASLAALDEKNWSKGEVSAAAVNNGYLEQAEQVYSFALRAPGYESDAAVWQALRERDDVAIITTNLIDGYDSETILSSAKFGITPIPEDSSSEGSNNENSGFTTTIDSSKETSETRHYLTLEGFSLEDKTLPEVNIALREPSGAASIGDLTTITSDDDTNSSGTTNTETINTENNASGKIHVVQIIGVIAQNTTLAGEKLQFNKHVLTKILAEPSNDAKYYFKASEGSDVHEVAQNLERTFISNSLNTSVMAESFAIKQSITRGVLQLLQGFLALGLLVGIAALGVISSRTVVERRQQVGVLRAIGFQPNMVTLSFMLEASFIALTGIVIGVVAGTVLGHKVIDIVYSTLALEQAFAVPWLHIGVIVLLTYLFSLLTTIIPAYQASRIYPAEALRYE